MVKPELGRIKKMLGIPLLVLFVISVGAAAVSAQGNANNYTKGALLAGPVSIPANRSIPTDVGITLESGKPYIIVGEGLFSFWSDHTDGVDSCFGYAKWRVGDTPQVWGSLQIIDPTANLSGLIEKQTGMPPVYNPFHAYEGVVFGEGKPLKAMIYDAGSYDDNNGELRISVYDAITVNQANSSVSDLTGVWRCDDGGTYYIRQSGDSIWWFGEPSTNPGVWSNVANGTIRDGSINLTWSDVPKGCTLNKGILVLNILSKENLRATNKTGGFGGSNWTRIAMTTCPSSTNTGQVSTTTGPGTTTTVSGSTTTTPGSTTATPGNQGALNPWEDPNARLLIDEWIRQQDNCLKKVYGSGAFIDQWGRACGNLGSTSVSCTLTPDHPVDWDSYHYLWANNWCPMYYPYTVQSYVKYRQAGYSFDSMATCKGAGESCIS